MTHPVYLKLEIDGNDIHGECTAIGLEREDTIECLSFESGVSTPIDGASGLSTGNRIHKPVIFIKQIDKSTPLLLEALCENQIVDNAEFMFFRTFISSSSRVKSLTEERFYTVLLQDGRISDVQHFSDDLTPSMKGSPAILEKVSVVYNNITWTYEEGGITHSDSWGSHS